MYRMMLTTAVVVAMASLAMAQNARPRLGEDDARFITDAIQDSMVKVAVGKMAAQSAGSDDVKAFGQRMVQDHGKIGNELAALARKKGVEAPRDLGPIHREPIDRVRDLTGDAFDKTYMQMMVAFHQKDVEKFEKMSSDSPDADVKAFAAKTLPMLKEHLELARETARKVGVEQ